MIAAVETSDSMPFLPFGPFNVCCKFFIYNKENSGLPDMRGLVFGNPADVQYLSSVVKIWTPKEAGKMPIVTLEGQETAKGLKDLDCRIAQVFKGNTGNEAYFLG